MLSDGRSLFLVALVSICFVGRCCAGEEICGKKCSSVFDCPGKLVCDHKGKCTNNPVVPPVRCPIPHCSPTRTFTYRNTTTTKERCQTNSTYQLFSCSPPIEERNFAILYLIDLEGLPVACSKNKSHNKSEMLANLATGWFNKGQSCFWNITITVLEENGVNGQSAVAKVVDECASDDGCSASTDYYEPCPPNSVGATKAVWEALGLKPSPTSVKYVTWSSGKIIGDGDDHRSTRVLLIVVSSGCAALLLVVLGSFVIYWRYQESQKRVLKAVERHLVEEIQQGVMRPQQFSYRTLYRATNGFNAKLKVGEGGFGIVYKGTLPNRATIVVKQIVSSNQGDKQFKAEVMSIGSIHHLNLVKLLGFCIHTGQPHMIVYEYVSNGSLDQWLFGKDKFLPWSRRVLIALDVARGLDYLHEGCRDKVLHLDIKPQNILLDGSMRAKIADFGFSKLIAKEESHVVTVMRGTMGYMAPEWLQMRVTDKTDVYSFGMVLLELGCGRKCMEFPKDQQEVEFLANIAFNKLNAGMGWELVDKRMISMTNEESSIDSDFNFDVFERMIRVGLWCIQEDPATRPTMEEVVKTLENVVNGVELASLTKPASNAAIALASTTTSENSMGQLSISISELAR